MAHLFSDLKVLDMATFIAGPGAATILSDFGADVIKVEIPGAGDPYRHLYRVSPNPRSSKNYMWQLTNRNKRSITLNLKSPRSKEIIKKLIAWADVMIVNYPPRVREKLGMTYDVASAINPRLIYADITGFGNKGPDADKPGFDLTAYWARSGLMDRTRNDDCPPAIPLPGMGDQPTAMTLYASIVTGLYRREKTGEGCHVSTALLAEGTWAAATWIQAALDGAQMPQHTDRKHPANALMNTYKTADGRWFLLIAEGEKRWPALMSALNMPAWATDERFCDSAHRSENASALTALLEATFATQPFAYWAEALDKAWIPYSLIQTIDENAHSPQLVENGFVVPIADGSETPRYTVDSPVYIEQETKVAPRLAPELGQHTREVLKACGYSDEEIEAMSEEGVI
uniref:CoA transferase n=1 Tax=Thermosporothrix sp. COM3 TaxID=2490863 RepID=A0A455SEQ9_9CHLR|nr:CoA transferase [Thermosporothrix sp. COM3]